MKKCPYCAEEIQEEAVKCKHCFEFLDETKRPLPPALPASAKSHLPWYFSTSFIIMMFCTMPPFALPSVWWHPRLGIAWKIVITLVALALCWASVLAFQGLMKELDDANKMLKSMNF